jgi:hypothetical protein
MQESDMKPSVEEALEFVTNKMRDLGQISAKDAEESIAMMKDDSSGQGKEFKLAMSLLIEHAYGLGGDDAMPIGHIAVPIEPTEEMLTAFNAWGCCAGYLPEAYKAMIEVVRAK